MEITQKLEPYVRDNRGRWTTKPRWNDIAAATIIVATAIYLLLFSLNRANELASRKTAESHPVSLPTIGTEMGNADCRKIAPRTYVCATAGDLAKWNKYLESENEKLETELGKPKNVFRSVCKQHGFTDTYCPSILYGMAMVESRMSADAIGDGGMSQGWFQIHLGFHKSVPVACAKDLRCAADWTLSRMVRLGFPKNSAIQRHNGTPGTPATNRYLKAVLAFSEDF